MKFSSKITSPEAVKTACIIAPIFESNALSSTASQLNNASEKYIINIIKKGDIEGKVGQTLLLHKVPGIKADRVLLVGCGKSGATSDKQYRKACASAVNAIKSLNADNAASALHEIDVEKKDLRWKAIQSVQIMASALDRRDMLKSEKDDPIKLNQITLTAIDKDESKVIKEGINIGDALAQGVSLAKELSDLPGNICTPSYLAEQAKTLGSANSNLKVTILDEKKMESLKMGALLSVSKGSRQPAKLIVMEYHGGKANKKPIVLVGKGLTFDAGGISLKPSAAMDEMKYDMCGAASVFGTIKAISELNLPLNVVGIVPSSENLPDGAANKPGDIVTSMAGLTIEILNTDAEGRLILCDALTYSERFKPDTVIDIATLTGACVIALGQHASGLFSNQDELAKDILAAGEESGDRCWQMPLWDDYNEQIKSNFADLANVGGREAGSITAACFLSKFTKNLNWAHVDIAGSAWQGGGDKGATGRPVQMLVQYLINRCQ